MRKLALRTIPEARSCHEKVTRSLRLRTPLAAVMRCKALRTAAALPRGGRRPPAHAAPNTTSRTHQHPRTQQHPAQGRWARSALEPANECSGPKGRDSWTPCGRPAGTREARTVSRTRLHPGQGRYARSALKPANQTAPRETSAGRTYAKRAWPVRAPQGCRRPCARDKSDNPGDQHVRKGRSKLHIGKESQH